jgi:hypothetical protein
MNRLEQENNANLRRIADAMEKMAKSMEKMVNPLMVVDVEKIKEEAIKGARPLEAALAEHDFAMFSSSCKEIPKEIPYVYSLQDGCFSFKGELLSIEETLKRLNEYEEKLNEQ